MKNPDDLEKHPLIPAILYSIYLHFSVLEKKSISIKNKYSNIITNRAQVTIVNFAGIGQFEYPRSKNKDPIDTGFNTRRYQ